MGITAWRPEAPHPHENGCGCEQCEINRTIAVYMLFWMPPTDRALRLPPRRD